MNRKNINPTASAVKKRTQRSPYVASPKKAYRNMLRIPNITSRWSSPDQAARKNVARGVYISVDGEAAVAVVPSFGQILLNDLAALRANLTCVASVHFNHFNPGAFSLGFEDAQ